MYLQIMKVYDIELSCCTYSHLVHSLSRERHVMSSTPCEIFYDGPLQATLKNATAFFYNGQIPARQPSGRRNVSNPFHHIQYLKAMV